jgi:hypothetical protein
MLRSCCVFVLFYLFAIYLLTIDTRSVPEDTIQSILNDPLNDTHRQLLHAFTGYRHRFEQSGNFKTLRWTLKINGLCELCDLGVPLVSLFVPIYC